MTLIRGWARDGLKDTQIAGKMGISSTTFYRWQNEHEEIREALKRGKAPVDVGLEDKAFDLGLGNCVVTETVTEIFTEGVDADGKPIEKSRHIRKVERHLPPSVTMLIFLLKNRLPEKYREKREELIQVSGADYSLLDDIAEAVKRDAQQ